MAGAISGALVASTSGAADGASADCVPDDYGELSADCRSRV